MTIQIQDNGSVIFTEGDFRRIIEPHKIRDLVGLNISGAENQAILDKWATIPPLPIDPPESPPTNQDLANDLALTQKVFRAFALVVLDQINILRAQHGLVDRTAQQIKDAIANKMS